ncbi:hypothetical protein IP84_13960 [beta proteobacterium AAP99]|nr:hypothetical protein IP84_13960 [beta proteobacterium AAP99]
MNQVFDSKTAKVEQLGDGTLRRQIMFGIEHRKGAPYPAPLWFCNRTNFFIEFAWAVHDHGGNSVLARALAEGELEICIPIRGQELH